MTCASIISSTVPPLTLTDKVEKALAQMEAGDFQHLPVLEEQAFRGVIALSDIHDMDGNQTLADLREYLSLSFVSEHDFFLTALKKINEQHLSLIPVLTAEGVYTGVVVTEALLEAAALYLNAGEPGGIIILQMPAHRFSISEIGRIVESNNAKLLHLTTWTDRLLGELMVSMKVNKIDIQDILASFERYEYNIYQYFGENLSEDTLKNNFENLMNYLKF